MSAPSSSSSLSSSLPPADFPLHLYEESKRLGVGVFAEVLALALDASRHAADAAYARMELPVAVAVKKFHGMAVKNLDPAEMNRREEKILRNLQHENIVAFHGVALAPGESTRCLVMELCTPDLRALVDCRRVLAEAEVVLLLSQILRATECMHAQGICHRDLKPANILFERMDPPDWETVQVARLRIKVADLGLSRFLSTTRVVESSTISMTVAGTPAYWAPEVESGRYDSKADVYSVGILTYELLTKERPSKELAPVQATSQPTDEAWKSPKFGLQMAQLLHRALQQDRKNRPKAKHLLHYLDIAGMVPAQQEEGAGAAGAREGGAQGAKPTSQQQQQQQQQRQQPGVPHPMEERVEEVQRTLPGINSLRVTENMVLIFYRKKAHVFSLSGPEFHHAIPADMSYLTFGDKDSDDFQDASGSYLAKRINPEWQIEVWQVRPEGPELRATVTVPDDLFEDKKSVGRLFVVDDSHLLVRVRVSIGGRTVLWLHNWRTGRSMTTTSSEKETFYPVPFVTSSAGEAEVTAGRTLTTAAIDGKSHHLCRIHLPSSPSGEMGEVARSPALPFSLKKLAPTLKRKRRSAEEVWVAGGEGRAKEVALVDMPSGKIVKWFWFDLPPGFSGIVNGIFELKEMLFCRLKNRMVAFELVDLPPSSSQSGARKPSPMPPFREFGLLGHWREVYCLPEEAFVYEFRDKLRFFTLDDVLALKKVTKPEESVPTLPREQA